MGRLVVEGTRPAKEESGCLRRRSDAKKHGAERMERNAAFSAGEEQGHRSQKLLILSQRS